MYEQADLEEVVNTCKDYVNTEKELMALNISKKASNILALLCLMIFTGCVIAVSVFLLSLAAAHYISFAWNKPYAGYFIVAGIYFLVGIVLLFKGKKLLVKPLRDLIIRELYREK